MSQFKLSSTPKPELFPLSLASRLGGGRRVEMQVLPCLLVKDSDSMKRPPTLARGKQARANAVLRGGRSGPSVSSPWSHAARDHPCECSPRWNGSDPSSTSWGGRAAPGLNFLWVYPSSSGTVSPTEGRPGSLAPSSSKAMSPWGRAESCALLLSLRVYVSSASVVLQRPSREQGRPLRPGQGRRGQRQGWPQGSGGEPGC